MIFSFKKLPLVLACATLIGAYPGVSSAFSITGDDKTKVDIYGYIKADARYDVNENLGNKSPAADINAVNATGLAPTTANQTDGHFNMTMQQTRLGLNFSQGTDSGDIAAKLEGDWASGGGLPMPFGFGMLTWSITAYW